MSKNWFKILFAYRNATANKKNALVVILTLSLVFCLLILLLGLNHTFSRIYQLQATNLYNDTDIVITYDEYSMSRLINNRYIKDDYQDDILYSLSFFNLDVLVNDEEGSYYGSLFSSLPYEFETLVDRDIYINDNETIISNSYAKEHNLNVGDSIEFTLKDKRFTYIIREIIPDTGVFTGISFYINKEAFYEEFYNIGFLTNLGNVLYINIKSDTDIDKLITDLKNDSNFAFYDIYPTVDWDYINSKAMDLTSVMLGVGLIILVSVIMVLDSLFPIVNRGYRLQIGITNTLGAEKKFIWQIYLLHWLIYSLISFVLGIILSYLVINIGLHEYGLNGFIGIKLFPMIEAFAIVSLFIIIRAYMEFKNENQMSVAKQNQDKRYISYNVKYISVGISFVIMLLAMYFKQIPQSYRSLLIVITSLYFIFNLSSIMLIYISKLLSSGKEKSVFKIFQLKYLRTNKHIHQSLRVVLISLLSLVLIFSVRIFIDKTIEDFDDMMSFDLAITNIYDYDDSLLNEVKNDSNVINSDSGLFYRNITIYFNEKDYQPCKFFISMNYNQFSNYFNLNTIDYDNQYINTNNPYVILPYNFKMVYDIKLGDVVTLDLNYKLNNISVVVVGFFDTDFDNIIYSNIINVDEYSSTAKANTILINSNNKDKEYQNLIQEYSSKMYFILDPDLYFNDYISSAENVINFFTVFTLFMIASFVIIVFNNTLLVFYDIKNDIAKIKVLGAGKSVFMINLLKEYLLILSIIISFGYTEILILSKHLKYVVLFTDYYKDVSSNLLTNLYGCVIVGIVLILSYIYYLYKINKIKIVDEIKML